MWLNPSRTKNAIACGLIALMLAAVVSASEAASPKLGWAGGDADDHNASNASWYYRWWHNIPASASGTLADFVPLIKYPNNIQNKVNEVASIAGTDTLLVLNEPERESQSNTTVQEALSIWPTIQNSLPNHRLVGPGFGDDAGGRAWMDEFMGEVNTLNSNANPNDDIRLDAIAFHWYGASSPNGVAAANNFLNRVDFFHNRYNRPVWITEFAMHDWEGNDPTPAMIQANADFLEIVIPALESRSYVERYSYYNWFDDARVFTDVDKAPTVIGDQYVGTLLPGDTRDLAGQSLGTDIVYLRGGALTSTGAEVPEAMRAIDALGGVSTLTGSADWTMAFRRDAYTRVRAGATLQKTGPARFELTGATTVDGTLRVSDGVLALKDALLTGGGTTVVEEGGVVSFSANGGRGVSAANAHTLDVAGRVEGPLRATGNSLVVTRGMAPSFADALTIQGSTLDVGGPGFSAGDPDVLPVSAGLRLNYDAAADTPGDNVWSDAGGSGDDFTFGQPISPIPVTSQAFPALKAAYPIGAVGGGAGLNQFFESGGPQRSRLDATFEVVFRVDDTSAGSDQVLLEVGGAGSGVTFVLNDDTLTFNVDGVGGDINLTQTLATGWHQAVGVIDLTAGDDTVTLYVNGQHVGALGGQTIDDWAGGNVAGLGAGQNSVTGVSSGVGSTFHGDLAIARYYENNAFTPAEALQNFEALTASLGSEPTVLMLENSLTLEGGSVLRLDLGDAGEADRVVVATNLLLNGALLSVSHVGEEPLAAGDQFDVLDFANVVGDFDAVSLPGLASGLMWSTDRLTVDGSLQVTLAGDYNGDGSVDAADYTVWRDAEGESVSTLTGADGNGDGLIDGADLAVWRSNFGKTVASLAASAVPEPAALSAIASVLLAFSATARPQQQR